MSRSTSVARSPKKSLTRQDTSVNNIDTSADDEEVINLDVFLDHITNTWCPQNKVPKFVFIVLEELMKTLKCQTAIGQ